MQNETKNCQNCKNDFTIESEDFDFYQKIKVPAPTFCQYCRAERRFAYRNERHLFRVKDAFTGQDVFSLYPTEGNRKSVTREEWHGDTWDGSDFGRDYDFTRPFFEQFFELVNEVPVCNLNVQMMIDSPYSGNATGLKNCYLCFNSTGSENCLYGNAIDFSKDCIDNSNINKSERCYQSFWLQNCYQCFFTIMCVESSNLWFSRDCLGCNDCFGSANLRKASYCIFNKQYTKEEYFEELKKMRLDTASGIKEAREKARAFWDTQPMKYHQGLKNINSTGSYIGYSKNVKDSYLIREGENLRYCQNMLVPKNKDCYDTSIWGANMELHYETCVSGDNSYNLKFCVNCWPSCKDSEYCMDLFSSSDCFGCVGLKKKQYCILNKQYTKDEYYKMVEKIKQQMNDLPYVDTKGRIYKYGEFFPIEFSPFGYNNTLAFEHFVNTKQGVLDSGYSFIEVEKGNYNITKKPSDVPDSIENVPDDFYKEVLECESCLSPYRVMQNELVFLKKEGLPIPRKCGNCRHVERISDRLKLYLYDRSCMCAGEADEGGKYTNTVKHAHASSHCGETFKTGYSTDRPEIVYCEKCYQQEVY